jgi:hypothetical protein
LILLYGKFRLITGEVSMKKTIRVHADHVLPVSFTPVLVVAVALLLLIAPAANSQQGGIRHAQRDVTGVETGLGPAPFYNYQGPGADFIKAGVSTRVYLGGLPATPQTEPFTLTVPALPTGANAVETFICWNYLLDGAPPATDGITVNGAPVTGSLFGSGTPDLCWNKYGVACYMAGGMTGIVNPGNSSVAVTIAGATDKALGADPDAFGEGLTILVVYDVSGEPGRNIDLYRGYISTETGAAPDVAAATLNYTAAYEGGDFHFFLNALDGQQNGDENFEIDGVSRGGQISGTMEAINAWHGLLGPAPGDNMLYDHANDDISAFLSTPDNSLDFATVQINDCVGHSFAGVSFPAGPQIPTLGEWGMIIFGVLLAGWMAWAIVRRRKANYCP